MRFFEQRSDEKVVRSLRVTDLTLRHIAELLCDQLIMPPQKARFICTKTIIDEG